MTHAPPNGIRRTLQALTLAALAAPAAAQGGPELAVSRVGSVDGSPGGFALLGVTDDFFAYAFANSACNEGSVPLIWQISQHPVIAQNLFGIKDGRIEHLGYSWVRHSFCAVNEATCGTCEPTSCATLGVGCATSHSASLSDGGMGHAKADCNGVTGVHDDDDLTEPSVDSPIIRGRLQLDRDDVDASTIYIAELQLNYAFDYLGGDGRDNASWRQVQVAANGSMTGQGTSTNIGRPGIEAWATFDSAVTLVDVTNVGEGGAGVDGHLVVAWRTEDLGGGQWRYDYAVQNLTSEQGVGAFALPLTCGAAVTDLTFHGTRHHSGSLYSNEPWDATTAGEVRWQTAESFTANPDANAIRWGELYSFGFTSTHAPVATVATLDLFEPGPGSTLLAAVEGPCGPCVGGTASYCQAALNSTGAGALITGTGSTSVGANDLALSVAGAPADQFGLFFYGAGQTQSPFGEGFLCVDAAGGGLFRLNPPQAIDGAGGTVRQLDNTTPPEPAAQITAGSTWNFQFWYRDPAGGGSNFNLSDGLSADFCP